MEILNTISSNKYSSENFSMEREFEGKTPNGNDFGGRWVLRNRKGQYIDHDSYRNDLAERWDLEFREDKDL